MSMRPLSNTPIISPWLIISVVVYKWVSLAKLGVSTCRSSDRAVAYQQKPCSEKYSLSHVFSTSQWKWYNAYKNKSTKIRRNWDDWSNCAIAVSRHPCCTCALINNSLKPIRIGYCAKLTNRARFAVVCILTEGNDVIRCPKQLQCK